MNLYPELMGLLALLFIFLIITTISLAVFFYFIPFWLWLKAFSCGVPIGIVELVAMSKSRIIKLTVFIKCVIIF